MGWHKVGCWWWYRGREEGVELQKLHLAKVRSVPVRDSTHKWVSV